MVGEQNPILGVTTYLERARCGIWDVPASFLPASYLAGITAAGGTPVLLAPTAPEAAEAVVDRLDALVITGGRDLDPAGYDQSPHPAAEEPGADRDHWEFALLAAALNRKMPVLGICRGAQVLNVALGGTLHQHLPDLVGHDGHQVGGAVFATRTAHTVSGTRVAALLGPTPQVPCYHHQAIAELGAGLIVAARGDDGVIEAVELPDAGFVVAVQWHPEEDLDDLRLFSAVVAAAGRYAADRDGGGDPRQVAGR